MSIPPNPEKLRPNRAPYLTLDGRIKLTLQQVAYVLCVGTPHIMKWVNAGLLIDHRPTPTSFPVFYQDEVELALKGSLRGVWAMLHNSKVRRVQLYTPDQCQPIRPEPKPKKDAPPRRLENESSVVAGAMVIMAGLMATCPSGADLDRLADLAMRGAKAVASKE